jgi:hypothetical protein
MVTMSLTTDKWYGYYLVNDYIWNIFNRKLDAYIRNYYSKIIKLFDKQNLTDLMYVLVCDNSYFTDIHHRMGVLCVGYSIITLYGYITFSCLKYKYEYLEKITTIFKYVCDDIRKCVGQQFLISCGIFAGVTYGLYRVLV